MHTNPTPAAPGPMLGHIKLAALIIFAGLCLLLSVRLVQGGLALGVVGWFPVLAVAGYVAADLVSGVVHFLADNFAEADTPLVGPTFVRPFREHHTDPTGITRHGFVETNGNNVIVSLPFLVPVLLWVPVTSSVSAWVIGAFILCFLFAVFLTNQFHKWAHEPDPPAIARRLQAAGLILSKSHHDVHHTSPFNTHYCITVGLWNPLLQRLRVFDRAERAMRRWIPGTDPRLRVEREAEAHAALLAGESAHG